MMLLRPVRMEDHDSVLALARQAGIGFTSLPPDAEVLERKIANAVGSFQGKPKRPQEENFLFVLEDTGTKKLVGTCGIAAHVGLSRPFYSYKLSTITQVSRAPYIYSSQRVLHMVNDYTGASEVGSLFLAPDYRRDGIGKFLARSRYLMLAEFPALFSDIVISEIRGVQDAKNNSPFYDNLARHFFQMEFREADYINATQGSQFIADLMPKYPIYVTLLPREAQDVIGLPFEGSRPAMLMLEREGFRWQGYVDVFDGGPTMQGERAVIRTVRISQRAEVADIIKSVEGTPIMLSNTVCESFRVCRAAMQNLGGGKVAIAQETAVLLGVHKGDMVRFAE